MNCRFTVRGAGGCVSGAGPTETPKVRGLTTPDANARARRSRVRLWGWAAPKRAGEPDLARLAAKQCEKSRRRVEKNCAKRVTRILRATFLRARKEAYRAARHDAHDETCGRASRGGRARVGLARRRGVREHADVQSLGALGACLEKGHVLERRARHSDSRRDHRARHRARLAYGPADPDIVPPLLLPAPAAQQTGLGADPYEVEWIATQNGKVRASSDKKGTTSRWSAAEEKNRRRKKTIRRVLARRGVVSDRP